MSEVVEEEVVRVIEVQIEEAEIGTVVVKVIVEEGMAVITVEIAEAGEAVTAVGAVAVAAIVVTPDGMRPG